MAMFALSKCPLPLALATALSLATIGSLHAEGLDIEAPAAFPDRVDDFARLFTLSCVATEGDPLQIETLSTEGAIWSAAVEVTDEDELVLNAERQSWAMTSDNPLYVLAFGPADHAGKDELECSLATPGAATNARDAQAEIRKLLGVLATQYVMQRTESITLRGPGLENGRITDDATVVLTGLEAPGRGDQKLEHSWSGGWHLLTFYRPIRREGWWWE